MAHKGGWQTIVSDVLKSATAAERGSGEAMRRASDIYHGRSTRSNPPSRLPLLKLAIIAGAGYAGYTLYKKQQAAAAPKPSPGANGI